MEELTEILTWSKLELHSKPIALLNVAGYYDSFLQWVSWEPVIELHAYTSCSSYINSYSLPAVLILIVIHFL